MCKLFDFLSIDSMLIENYIEIEIENDTFIAS